MRRIRWTVSLLALVGALSAQAGETRHLNFAVMQKTQKGFEFDPIVVGDFPTFIQSMKGAKVLLLAHTARAVDGDVINMQTNVLREKGNKLGDEGVECQLSFKDESTPGNPMFTVGGICRVRQGDHVLKHVIPPAALPDTTQGVDAWVMLDEDDKAGVAFYANAGK